MPLTRVLDVSWRPKASVRRRLARAGIAAASGITVMCAAILATAEPASAAAFVPINGAGSTWSFNAINGWITRVSSIGMAVTYQPVGSASGRQEFAAGTTDWAVSEFPYGVQDGSNVDPPPARGYTYMPDTAGGIALMYNLQIGGTRVTNLRLSGAVIAGIFTNQITVWNDPRIAADNPGLTLPAERIIPVVRSDGAGATWPFTQWMSATEAAAWVPYCAVVGRSPCTPTAAYPVQAGTNMVGQAGDLGVSGYVSQPTAEGAIGYTEYATALESGFPVAKVLNAAGYYTAPTPDNVGVSLLQAQVNTNPSDPLYQTEDLSKVYSDSDPRTYELSYYSYMILPTTLTAPMTTAKGYTIGAFGQYLLCQGQQQVNALGYAALPINLVEDGFSQLRTVPGSQLPADTSAELQSCDNPTFAPDGTNLLASYAPNPPACDQQGPTQCTTASSGPVSTTTTLTASPNQPAPGATVTLTATESAADGTTPDGTVQFGVGSTDIGTPAAVNAGVAATTTSFAAGMTAALWAVFLPASLTYATSEATLALTVPGTAGSVPIAVTVPATGALTVSVAPGAVDLAEQGTTPPATSIGTLNDVTVTDTRNTYPGWVVDGQMSGFTGGSGGSAATISGDQLGWSPTAVSPLVGGATLGPVVTPGTNPNGLGDTAQVLAAAPGGQGVGTNTLSANLTLSIPVATPAGVYSGLLTITYLEAGPVQIVVTF
ncbi:MAG TPA: substrate-binding domain-containing protein [Streptosporangiaceae bacterium]